MTGVSEGMGAGVAGLQSGDIVLAANGVSGTELISVLQDRTQGYVQLDIQPVWSTERRTLMVQRGVGSETSPRVPTVLKMAASGDLQGAEQLWRDGPVETDNIPTALRLVARNYPQQYPKWLTALEEHVSINIPVLQALMQGYNATRQPEKVIEVYDQWNTSVGWDVWLKNGPLNTHSNLTIEKALLTALWNTNQTDRAIAHMREVQRWHANTGLESIVSMAPTSDNTAIWSDKKPKFAGMKGLDSSGQTWSIGDQSWTVLAFWATWCAPCKKELPELSAWAKKRSDVTVLAVNVDDNLHDKGVLKALDKLNATNLVGLRSPTLNEMVELQAIPTVVLIDANGIERYRMLGYAPTTIAEMEARMIDVAPRVQLGESRGVRVQWFSRPSVVDAVFDARDFWVLDEQSINQVPDIYAWLNEEERPVKQLGLQTVSENSIPERLIYTRGQAGVVYNNGRLIRFFTDTGGTVLSIGEPLVDWAYINEGFWLWTKNDLRSAWDTSKKLEQELQYDYDKELSKQDTRPFGLTLPVEQFLNVFGGMDMFEEQKQNGEQPVLLMDDIAERIEWDSVRWHTERVYSTGRMMDGDTSLTIATAGLLGKDILSVVQTAEYTWLLRQHSSIKNRTYSILALDSDLQPVGSVSNLIERPQIVMGYPSLEQDEKAGREIWAVIPRRGMMRIEIDAAQDSEH